MRRPRWEGDERGSGMQDGSAFAPGLDALRAAMLADGWVAEDPHVHLLPEMVAHLERSSGPLRLLGSDVSDGTFIVELEAPEAMNPRELRRAVFGVVGSVAETATFVREIPTGKAAGVRVFELTTGSLEGDSPYAGHGHTVKLVVARAGT